MNVTRGRETVSILVVFESHDGTHIVKDPRVAHGDVCQVSTSTVLNDSQGKRGKGRRRKKSKDACPVIDLKGMENTPAHVELEDRLDVS